MLKNHNLGISEWKTLIVYLLSAPGFLLSNSRAASFQCSAVAVAAIKFYQLKYKCVSHPLKLQK